MNCHIEGDRNRQKKLSRKFALTCGRLLSGKAYPVWLAAAVLALAGIGAKEKSVALGSRAEKLTFKDIHYLPRTLDDLGSAKAYVLIFTTTGCPLVQRYLPRLQELYSQYKTQGVRF